MFYNTTICLNWIRNVSSKTSVPRYKYTVISFLVAESSRVCFPRAISYTNSHVG